LSSQLESMALLHALTCPAHARTHARTHTRAQVHKVSASFPTAVAAAALLADLTACSALAAAASSLPAQVRVGVRVRVRGRHCAVQRWAGGVHAPWDLCAALRMSQLLLQAVGAAHSLGLNPPAPPSPLAD